MVQTIRDPLKRSEMRKENRFKYYRLQKKYIAFCSKHEEYYINDFIKQIESKIYYLLNQKQINAQISSRIGELCAKDL